MAVLKCKVCGGELVLRDGKGTCQHCGTVVEPNRVYENVDVYLCYVENDESGRRTRDSLIAQEVYQKLEGAGIDTFFERVSADGLIGDDLELVRYAAKEKAKAVLVLGASVESFNAIAQKQGEFLEGKTVIPFCADANPALIPKELSKVQAVNYNNIGWEKDLINGLYNLLGKENKVDSAALYGEARKKKLILLFSVLGVLLIAAAVALILLLGGKDKPKEPKPEEKKEQKKELTEKEIYEKAISLTEKEQYVEALALFAKIPDHPDCANKVALIYAKYEGYYQSGDLSLYLDVGDDLSAKIDFTQNAQDRIFRISAEAAISQAVVKATYLDNLQKSGNATLTLENGGVRFVYQADGAEGSTECFFELASKTDSVIVQIPGQTLISWLNEQLTPEQLQERGYEVELESFTDRAETDAIYRVKDTDIQITMSYIKAPHDKPQVVGVSAPAYILAPDAVGKSTMPYMVGDLVYWPGGVLYVEGGALPSMYTQWDGNAVEEVISENTLIGVARTTDWDFEYCMDGLLCHLGAAAVETQARSKYNLPYYCFRNYYGEIEILTYNDTHILYKVQNQDMEDAGICAMYRYDRKNNSAVFVKEGNYKENDRYKITSSLWFSEYLDLAREFPDYYDVLPDSDEWNEKVKEIMEDKASDLAFERYPSSGYCSVSVVAENNTHFLIYTQAPVQQDANQCGWYRGSKKNGIVTFYMEGPDTGAYNIPKDLWLKAYPDLAREFPSRHGTPEQSTLPYLKDAPYSVTTTEEVRAYEGPAYKNYVKDLPAGTYTVIEDQYDFSYGEYWGKLENGSWICLSVLYESF